MILEPQLSFPKENWIEYAKELQKENTQHITRIKELEATIASMSDENESISGLVVEIGEKDAKIKQLEDWLKEEKAQNLLNFQRHDEEEERSWDNLSETERADRIEFAGDCLIAEGKL